MELPWRLCPHLKKAAVGADMLARLFMRKAAVAADMPVRLVMTHLCHWQPILL
jgi:hypothetical protein